MAGWESKGLYLHIFLHLSAPMNHLADWLTHSLTHSLKDRKSRVVSSPCHCHQAQFPRTTCCCHSTVTVLLPPTDSQPTARRRASSTHTPPTPKTAPNLSSWKWENSSISWDNPTCWNIENTSNNTGTTRRAENGGKHTHTHARTHARTHTHTHTPASAYKHSRASWTWKHENQYSNKPTFWN